MWILNNAWHDWTYGDTFDFVSNMADTWLDLFWDDNPSFVLIWLNFLDRKLFDDIVWDFKWFCVPSQILCNFIMRIQEISIKWALPIHLNTWLPKFIHCNLKGCLIIQQHVMCQLNENHCLDFSRYVIQFLYCKMSVLQQLYSTFLIHFLYRFVLHWKNFHINKSFLHVISCSFYTQYQLHFIPKM